MSGNAKHVSTAQFLFGQILRISRRFRSWAIAARIRFGISSGLSVSVERLRRRRRSGLGLSASGSLERDFANGSSVYIGSSFHVAAAEELRKQRPACADVGKDSIESIPKAAAGDECKKARKRGRKGPFISGELQRPPDGGFAQERNKRSVLQ